MKITINKLCVCGILAALLFTASCSEIFDNAPKSKSGQGGLYITISSAEMPARTLYPHANFSKYVLSFQPDATTVGHPDVTLTEGEDVIAINDLANDTWKITVTGYLTLNGESYEAAMGEAKVEVVSGSFETVNIEISATETSGNPNGFFAYDVSFPDLEYTSRKMTIESFNGAVLKTVDLEDIANRSGNEALAPGYYLLNVQLTTDFQIVAWTEIVHILSNMTTEWEQVFRYADFTGSFILSGDINVTVNNNVPTSDVSIGVYSGKKISDDEETGEPVYNSETRNWEGTASVGSDNEWSVTIPVFEDDTPLYFVVDVDNLTKELSDTITVREANAYINLGTVTFGSITIGGKADVKVNGETPDSAHVRAFTEETYTDSSMVGSAWIKDGEWAMTLEPFDADTTLYFQVAASVFNRNINVQKGAGNATVKDQSKTDIDIDVAIKTFDLGGTSNITVNGAKPDSAEVRIYSGKEGGELVNFVTKTPVNLEDGNWSMWMQEFDSDTTLYFEVEAYYLGTPYRQDTNVDVSVKDADKTDIALGDLAIAIETITLSGTVTVRLNGQTPESVDLFVYSDQGYRNIIGVGAVNNNTWTSAIPTTNATVYFRVAARGTGGTVYVFQDAGNRALSNTDVSNIALGMININTRTIQGTVSQNPVEVYALSGSISSLAVSMDDPEVMAVRLGYRWVWAANGQWTMQIANTAPNSLWFVVGVPVADLTTDYYITNTAINSGWVTLNINNNMTKFATVVSQRQEEVEVP